jgi:hypothetical protein
VSGTSIKIERQMFMEQVMACLILLENSNDSGHESNALAGGP